jgi:adenylylsulfate kinase
MTDEVVRAVLLTGPIGAGKTVVAMELGELLAERGLPTAVIDLDWLGWFHPGDAPGATPDELIADNLRAVWPRFREAGARYLVLARALTTGAQVAAVRDALGDVELTVVLVHASTGAIAERLGRRDEGEVLREHLAESEVMARALAGAGFANLRIENERGPVRDAADELLEALGWAPEGAPRGPSATG